MTPSLRNLSQDPSMDAALIYYLSSGETLVTTTDDDEAGAGASTIQLNGGGIMARHCTLDVSRGSSAPIRLIPGSGVCFVNGKQVTDEMTIKHDDRLILAHGADEQQTHIHLRATDLRERRNGSSWQFLDESAILRQG